MNVGITPGGAEWALIHGEALETLKTFTENSFDALVTDPPAGIDFMGNEWDSDKGGRDNWIAWLKEIMTECYRVLKPGAHGLVWALPRTSHWTTMACEDAGFEIRDVVMHLFGTGFPKSLDFAADPTKRPAREPRPEFKDTPYAEGWGTALKPAAEHWILVRKPPETTVAQNVLKYGTGAMNIGDSRIEGRWPSHVVLDEEAAESLDEQSGILHARGNVKQSYGGGGSGNTVVIGDRHLSNHHERPELKKSGGASRFFYVAKPSSKERDLGLEALPTLSGGELCERKEDALGLKSPRAGAGRNGNRKNNHPTVKSIALMRYLCKLITPPKGLILDPFCGSGTTVIAAGLDDFNCIAIEKEAKYAKLADARIRKWLKGETK
jgi:DNA modification methylase